MAKLSSNKKILITVLAFVIVVAAVIGILVIINGSNKAGTDEPSSEYIYETAAPEATEPQSSTLPTTSPAMNTGGLNSSPQVKMIEAYIDGSYYISATMVDSDGAATDMDMAVRGNDFQTTMDVEGVTLTMMYLNSTLYFVNNDTNKYFALSSALMSSFGIDMSEMEELLDNMSLSDYEFTDMDQTVEELNGIEYDCYKCYNSEVSVNFYFIGEEMKLIEFGDSGGSIASYIEVNSFSAEIPSGMLTLSGYTQAGMMEFFGETM